MANLYETLALKFKLDNSSINTDLRTTSRLTTQMLSDMKMGASAFNDEWADLTSGIKDTKRIVSGILISQAFYAVSNAIVQASASMLTFNSNMEQAQISMKYFVEGTDKAAKAAAYLRTVNTFAADTPFNTEDALALSKYMQAMGIAMSNTKSVLSTISDTASATGATEENMQRIVFGLGQIKTKGRLANEEIRQLANANIPIYDILQEELGLTGKQISNIGNMWVDADKAVVAILNGLQARYKGASEEVSNTAGGMIETLKDDALIISQTVLGGVYTKATGKLGELRDALDKYRDIANTQGSAGLFHTILTDLDASGEIGTYLLALIGNIDKLGGSLHNLLSAASPLLGVLAKTGYAGITALTVSVRLLADGVVVLEKVGEGMTGLINDLLHKIPGLSDVTFSLSDALAALLIAKTVGSVFTFLGNGLLTMGNNIVTTTQGIWAMIPALNGMSLAGKIATTSVLGILGAVALAASAKSMVSSLAGMNASKNGLPTDYEGAYAEYQKKMDAYNQSIEKYQKDYEDPFSSIANDGASAFQDVEDASTKAAKKVKDTWLASFDEVYAIPENVADAADDATKKLDFGTDLFPPTFKFPTFDDTMPKMPTLDFGNIFADSTDDELNGLKNMLPGIIGTALIPLLGAIGTWRNKRKLPDDVRKPEPLKKVPDIRDEPRVKRLIETKNTAALEDNTRALQEYKKKFEETNDKPSKDIIRKQLEEAIEKTDKSLEDLNTTLVVNDKKPIEEPSIIKEAKDAAGEYDFNEVLGRYINGEATDKELIAVVKNLSDEVKKKIFNNNAPLASSAQLTDSRALRYALLDNEQQGELLANEIANMSRNLSNLNNTDVYNAKNDYKNIKDYFDAKYPVEAAVLKQLNKIADNNAKIEVNTRETAALKEALKYPRGLSAGSVGSTNDMLLKLTESIKETVIENKALINLVNGMLPETRKNIAAAHVQNVTNDSFKSMITDVRSTFDSISRSLKAIEEYSADIIFKEDAGISLLNRTMGQIDTTIGRIADYPNNKSIVDTLTNIKLAIDNALKTSIKPDMTSLKAFDQITLALKQASMDNKVNADIYDAVLSTFVKLENGTTGIISSIESVLKQRKDAQEKNGIQKLSDTLDKNTSDAYSMLRSKISDIQDKIESGIIDTASKITTEMNKAILETQKAAPSSYVANIDKISELIAVSNEDANEMLEEVKDARKAGIRTAADDIKAANKSTTSKDAHNFLNALFDQMPSTGTPDIFNASMLDKVPKDLPEAIAEGTYKGVKIFSDYGYRLFAGESAAMTGQSTYGTRVSNVLANDLTPEFRALNKIPGKLDDIIEFNKTAFGSISFPAILKELNALTEAELGLSLTKGTTGATAAYAKDFPGAAKIDAVLSDIKSYTFDEKTLRYKEAEAGQTPNRVDIQQIAPVDIRTSRSDNFKELKSILETDGKLISENGKLIYELTENGFNKIIPLFSDMADSASMIAAVTGNKDVWMALADVKGAGIDWSAVKNTTIDKYNATGMYDEGVKYITKEIENAIVKNYDQIKDLVANHTFLIKVTPTEEAKRRAIQRAEALQTARQMFAELVQQGVDAKKLLQFENASFKKISDITSKRYTMSDVNAFNVSDNGKVNTMIRNLLAQIIGPNQTISERAFEQLKKINEVLENSIKANGGSIINDKVLTVKLQNDGQIVTLKQTGEQIFKTTEKLRSLIGAVPYSIEVATTRLSDNINKLNRAANSFAPHIDSLSTLVDDSNTFKMLLSKISADVKTLETYYETSSDIRTKINAMEASGTPTAIKENPFSSLDIDGYIKKYSDIQSDLINGTEAEKIAPITELQNDVQSIESNNKVIEKLLAAGNDINTVTAAATTKIATRTIDTSRVPAGVASNSVKPYTAIDDILNEMLSRTLLDSTRWLGPFSKAIKDINFTSVTYDINGLSAAINDFHTVTSTSDILNNIKKSVDNYNDIDKILSGINLGDFADSASTMDDAVKQANTAFRSGANDAADAAEEAESFAGAAGDAAKAAGKVRDFSKLADFSKILSGVSGIFDDIFLGFGDVARSLKALSAQADFLKGASFASKLGKVGEVLSAGASMIPGIGALILAVLGVYGTITDVVGTVNIYKEMDKMKKDAAEGVKGLSTPDKAWTPENQLGSLVKTLPSNLGYILEDMVGLNTATQKVLDNYEKMSPREKAVYGEKYIDSGSRLGMFSGGTNYATLQRIINNADVSKETDVEDWYASKTKGTEYVAKIQLMNAFSQLFGNSMDTGYVGTNGQSPDEYLDTQFANHGPLEVLIERAVLTGSRDAYSKDLKNAFGDLNKAYVEHAGIVFDKEWYADIDALLKTNGAEIRKTLADYKIPNAENVLSSKDVTAQMVPVFEELIKSTQANIQSIVLPQLQGKQEFTSDNKSMLTGNTNATLDLGGAHFSSIDADVQEEISSTLGIYMRSFDKSNGQVVDVLSTDLSKMSDNILGWTQHLPDSINVGDISTQDATILAKAGIQINADGTVSLMKAANMGMTGTDRESSLTADDLSGYVKGLLGSSGINFAQNETGKLDLDLDTSTISKKVQSAMFISPKDLAGAVTPSVEKALAGLGNVLDSGYLEITNKAVLSGKMTAQEYFESLGYNFENGEYVSKTGDKISGEIVKAFTSIDTLLQSKGATTAEDIAKLADGITIKSPISAEELTPEIEAAFKAVGISFEKGTDGLMMVINQMGDGIKEGVVKVSAESWSKLSDGAVEALDLLGVKCTEEAGIVSVDISAAMEKGITGLVELYTNRPDLWDKIPATVKDALEKAGFVSEEGMLKISANTVTSLVHLNDEWYGYWDKFSPEVVKAMGASELSTQGSCIKIAQYIEGMDLKGGIKIAYKDLPQEIKDQMGNVTDEMKTQSFVLTSTTEDAFAGVANAIIGAMGDAEESAVLSAQSIARAVGDALTQINNLSDAKTRAEEAANKGITHSGNIATNTRQTTLNLSGSTKTFSISDIYKDGEFQYYSVEDAGTGKIKTYKTYPSVTQLQEFKMGGVINDDGLYRAGEFGMAEAVIPLEQAAALKQVGSAIANFLPTADIAHGLSAAIGVPNGGITAPQVQQQQQTQSGTQAAKEMLETLLPILSKNNNSSSDTRPIAMVGTLIADDRGLKELDKRLEIVRLRRG